MNKEEVKAKLEVLKGEKQEKLVEASAELQKLQDGIVMIDEVEVAVEQLVAEADAAGYKRGQDSIVLPDPADPTKIYSQAEADQIAANSLKDGQDQKAAELQPLLDEALVKVAALEAKVLDLEAQLVAKSEEHEAYKAANIAQAQGI
jgi:hypothetical protein